MKNYYLIFKWYICDYWRHLFERYLIILTVFFKNVIVEINKFQ